MGNKPDRRKFLKDLGMGSLASTILPVHLAGGEGVANDEGTESKQFKGVATKHKYNDTYTGEYLNRIAFPIGGIGAGMFCVEGTGAISHMSVRNKPEMFNEPGLFIEKCVQLVR